MKKKEELGNSFPAMKLVSTLLTSGAVTSEQYRSAMW